jgi:hypothetical protein
VRLRYDAFRARLSGPAPERPLTSYLADPPREVLHGLQVSRDAFARIAERAAGIGARTGLVLMPARFQTDDGDYGRLEAAVSQAGGTLIRNAATDRFWHTLTPMGLPIVDLLPVLESQPDRSGLFFQGNIHLTLRGHQVVADALAEFVVTSGLAAPAH